MMNQQAQMAAMRQQMIRQPQLFAQNALRSGYFNNPMCKSALEAVQNNDEEKSKELVENLCKEHGVSVEDAQKQYRQYYGLN